MTFKIEDNAPAPRTIADYIPDWHHDLYDAGTPTEQIAHDFAYNIIGKMEDYRTAANLARYVRRNWQFIGMLYDQDPDLFIEVLTAFGDRRNELA